MLDRGIHALVHFAVQCLQVVDVHPRASIHAVTTDPTASPAIARLMFPGVSRLNTTIGRWLSMQSDTAVASMTLSPCSSTWRYEIRSKRDARGWIIGSAS